MSLVDQLTSLYQQFISIFPLSLQWVISLIIFIAIVVGVVNLVRRNFIFLLLLILLVPASIPLLRSIVNGLIAFLQNLL